MNKTMAVTQQRTIPKSFLPVQTSILQRKCTCGSHMSAGGECKECAAKKEVLQRKLAIGASNDPLEQEADRIVDQVMSISSHSAINRAPVKVQRVTGSPSGQEIEAPASVERVLASPGRLLEPTLRQDMESRFGHDFSQVRVHTGNAAEQSTQEVNARAYSIDSHIVFGSAQYKPDTRAGFYLLAHELAHVLQRSGGIAAFIRRAPSRGKSMTDAADRWLQTDISIKEKVDKLKAALKEIKKRKNLEWNRKAGKKLIGDLGNQLSLEVAKINELKNIWDKLINTNKDFGKNEKELLRDLRSPLKRISDNYPESSAKYWLKNTPTQVADLLYRVADSDLPIDELYVYAAREGLVELVRDQLSLNVKDEPTKAQLQSFDTNKEVSGFDYLGSDDFMTELDAKRYPMRDFLPKGYDLSKVKEKKHINEKGREVPSADFPNLLMALQGMAAIIKRRRKLFLEDAKAEGYADPTREELVYWTYLYFNTGEFGGKGQLQKYKGKRKLSDWIRLKEYPNSIIVLESYKMLKNMDKEAKIF